jgi:uncharacterized protein (DUF924 family)
MYNEIIRFWFDEITPAQWWSKDPAFDLLITQRFAKIHQQAARSELFTWRDEPRGRLAEIIVLDQFSRNMFRNTAAAFSCDPLALSLAQHAVSIGADLELPQLQRSFIYMPFMHSESLLVHQTALELFSANALERNLNSEIQHQKIIERFGRYPHRNKMLTRPSTAEEVAFLKQAGTSF